MDKAIIQGRISALSAFLEQAGKRLSAKTVEQINSVISSLTALLGLEDAKEEAVEQACIPLGNILTQAIVTGETFDETYEAFLRKLASAVYKSEIIPGSYKSSMWTWTDKVLVWSENYISGKGYEHHYYLVDYTQDGDNFTFSNVREANIQQIVVLLDETANPPADPPGTETVDAAQAIPFGVVIEQEGDKLPFLIQQSAFKVNAQADKKTGKVLFEGTATVADVKNSYGMVYPLQFWQYHTAMAQDKIAQGRMLGSSGHKSDAQGYPRLPEPNELTHKFLSLRMDGNEVKFQAETLSTDAGKNMAALLMDDVGLDMSTVVTAKTKKAEWQGEKVDMVQIEGSELYFIDVVLRGASPGSTVDDAKLQAKEHRKGIAMEKDEILKLIQDTIADGGSAETIARLQAQLDELKDSQGQVHGMTPEQETLLQDAQKIVDADKARQLIQARDTKVTEVITQMVKDGELPDALQKQATGILQGMASTVETVDAKLQEFKVIMAPFVEERKILQSKGFYVSEYHDDGTTKKKLDTPEQVIDDIMQSAVVRKVLPQDTGVDDPSNLNRNVKVMLQTMAVERPGYAAAYAAMKNKTVQTPTDMKHYLQQNFSMLGQEIPTGAMTTEDVAAAIPYLMGIAAEMTPMMVASRYASIQPMSKSLGTIAYWKIKDQDGNAIKTAAGFTGSYANDPGEKQKIKRIKGALTTETITPTPKKLGYDLSIEVIKRLRTDWGMDASSVMINECANDIALELNYNHLATMLGAAATGAGNWNYGTAVPAGAIFDAEQWQKQIMKYAQSVRAGIFKKTFAPTVAILGDADAISRMMWLANEVGMMSDTPGAGMVSRGVDIVGSLRTGEELVSVGWWEDLGAANKLLFIGRGQEWYRSGYVVAPYGGPYVSPAWVDPDTLDYMQSMMVETAEKMVDKNYFATLTIQPGVAGTPL
jgi:hypothetical protein